MEHGHGAHMPSGVLGSSFTPYARERLDLEAAARVGRRRSRPVVALLVALAVLGAAAVVAMSITSEQTVRSRAYAAVQSADERHAQKFLSCALPGMDVRQAAIKGRLRSMMEQASQRLGTGTGKRIGQCMPELTALSTEVRRVRVLDDALGERAALQAAITNLTTTWDEYQAFAAAAPHDRLNALPYMDDAAAAWTRYEQRRDALFEALMPARER
jgi:hypothetical protein